VLLYHDTRLQVKLDLFAKDGLSDSQMEQQQQTENDIHTDRQTDKKCTVTHMDKHMNTYDVDDLSEGQTEGNVEWI